MNIKIAELEISTDERLYGTLIRDLEEIGYLVIVEGDTLRNKFILARKED